MTVCGTRNTRERCPFKLDDTDLYYGGDKLSVSYGEMVEDNRYAYALDRTTRISGAIRRLRGVSDDLAVASIEKAIAIKNSANCF